MRIKDIKDHDKKMDIVRSIISDYFPDVKSEYRVMFGRKWRFDFAVPYEKIGIEIEGGIYTNGRHTRGKGYQNDIEKYNAAIVTGWKLLRFTYDQIDNGYMTDILNKVKIQCLMK